MISHLKEKPSKETILETINKAAKIEFDFLLNGIKSTELIEVDSNEIINLIDVNTKALKIKVSLFSFIFLFICFCENFFYFLIKFELKKNSSSTRSKTAKK